MYTCGTSFLHDPDVAFYDSVELLKQEWECWKECGIVEVVMTESKWVEAQNLFGEKSDT